MAGLDWVQVDVGFPMSLSVEDGHLVLSAPDLYFRQWVETHYGPMVELLVQDVGLMGVHWRLPEDTEGTRAAGA